MPYVKGMFYIAEMHQVLFEKSASDMIVSDFCIHTNKESSLEIQGCSHLGRIIGDQFLMSYDRGKDLKKSLIPSCVGVQIGSRIINFRIGYIIVFDPGGVLGNGKCLGESSFAVMLIHCCWVLSVLIFVYDPGGDVVSML